MDAKNENFLFINFDIFSHFCSKHRLWVPIVGSNMQPMFWIKKKKERKMNSPVYPRFTIYKCASFRGSILHGHDILMPRIP